MQQQGLAISARSSRNIQAGWLDQLCAVAGLTGLDGQPGLDSNRLDRTGQGRTGQD